MLPESFVNRMKEMLGEEYEAFSEALKEERHQALRVNPLKAEPEDFARTGPFSLTPVPWAKTGFYYDKAQQPGKHPLHEAGVYYIQEPSAMAPAQFLQARPGERIDLRLTYASEMLRSNPEVNIKRVAEACGFGNTSYFSSQFKKKFGISPSAFRNGR